MPADWQSAMGEGELFTIWNQFKRSDGWVFLAAV